MAKMIAPELMEDPLVVVTVTKRDAASGRVEQRFTTIVEYSEVLLFRHMRNPGEWEAQVVPAAAFNQAGQAVALCW